MQPKTAHGEPSHTYDLVLVGTSFASSFFLLRYLQDAPRDVRVLVLEWGMRRPHAEMIATGEHTTVPEDSVMVNPHPWKQWISHVVFGGNSNCWWACVPRMLPEDFELQTRYGVGEDWPIGYDELEEDYCEAEVVLSASGPDFGAFIPRSRPYPQPPHRFNDPDRVLKRAYPDRYFPQPAARARRATPNRPRCCATAECHLCPIDAKFTISNELSHLYLDKRVELALGANVRTVETQGGIATGVSYEQGGKLRHARGDLVALGAGAITNPAILLRSGFDDPALGRYLNEQMSYQAVIKLDGLDNFQGSTSITGHGYMQYDGAHRRESAACLIEHQNKPELRMELGKWRQQMRLVLIFEDMPDPDNRVVLDPATNKPVLQWRDFSDYAYRGMERLRNVLPELLTPLPVETIEFGDQPSATDAHIQGTTRMGTDPSRSVVDANLVHHRVRNLLVLGSGAFVSCPPANPTLTLSALSLRAARSLS